MQALHSVYKDEIPSDQDAEKWITQRFHQDMDKLKADQAAKRAEFAKKDDWRYKEGK